MTNPNLQFGPYRTERVLGRGGMGVVYEVIEEGSGQRAAVKVLTVSLAGDQRIRERFAGEIETLKLLKHPRIVELLAYGEQEGQLFYAMELVPGRSLQDELIDGRRFSWLEVARFGVDVCDALRHAHDHGVVHRDLKPANLLLDAAGRVKLSDFGIAKMFGGTQLTSAGGVIGTADYMAPEQAEGRPATVKSDLYSLGSVLFALLSRRAPFESKTLHEVIRRLMSEEPLPLSRLVPEVPPEFESIVSQLLRKNPQERIPTALAVGKRLQALVDEAGQTVADPVDDGEYRLEDESPARPRRTTTPDTHRGARPTMALPSDTPYPGDLRRDDLNPLDPGVAVHLKPTIVRPESQFPAATPSVPVAPTTRFTTVDKDRRRTAGGRDADEPDRYLWLKIAPLAAVLALVAGGIVYLLWPPSAETLYRRIVVVAESGEEGQLAEIEDEINSFLARFPADERIDQVATWKEELERRKLRSRLERQTRGLAKKKASSPIEKHYLEALQDGALAPERAALKMRALVDLFDNDAKASEETKRFVELARSELKKLEAEVEAAGKDQSALLTARLDKADELRATDLPAAQAIWRGVATLYADKPWAAEFVSRAQQSLADR